MNIANFISFIIANLLTSLLGGHLVKKKYPEYSFPKLVAAFFIGYFVFFWLVSLV